MTQIELKGKHATAKVFTDNVDDVTVGQIINFLNQDFVEGEKVRIMPDCHAGKGAVIGTTMTVTDKVVPNLVGVDIGCGVLAYKVDVGDFDVESQKDLAKLDRHVNQQVPSGTSVRPTAHALNRFIDYDLVKAPFNEERARLSLGSLGGGNHFVELNVSDKTGDVYLVVHSGSRSLGAAVAKYHQQVAIAYHKGNKSEATELIAKLKAEGRQKDIQAELKKIKPNNIPDELAYLEGDELDDYLNDLRIAQDYAEYNRTAMLDAIVNKMGWSVKDVIHSTHNYLDMDDMILRKGAIAAYDEELIIPINMRDGSIIGKGKSNADWNYSAPHGAGRVMSRSQAKREVDLEDFIDTMEGVYSTSVGTSTLDESPFAYKPIEEIVAFTGDTIEILDIVRPVYNFKARD